MWRSRAGYGPLVSGDAPATGLFVCVCVVVCGFVGDTTSRRVSPKMSLCVFLHGKGATLPRGAASVK